MKKLTIGFAILLVLWCLPAWAAHLYVAQTQAGDYSGSSCANAKAISYLTGSWSGKVSAGDTVHLCGTIGTENTTALTIGASGTNGNPITIKFEDNASLSTTYFPSTGAISLNGKDCITIDGGTNGIIENTENGSLLDFEKESHGIYSIQSSNLEIKNLNVRNIFVHVFDDRYCSLDPKADDKTKVQTGAIKWVINTVVGYADATTITLSGTTISDGYYGMYAFDIGTDDVIHLIQSSVNADGGSLSTTVALNGLPATAADHVRIGYLTVLGNGANFVPGTTALDAGTVTATLTRGAYFCEHNGIIIYGGSTVTVHDNVISHVSCPIKYVNVSYGTYSDVQIYNNTTTKSNWGIGVASSGADTLIDGLKIYGNDITIGSNYSIAAGGGDSYHVNGMMIWGDTYGTIADPEIYNNYIHGETSPEGAWATTALIYWTDINADTLKVYNNIFTSDGGNITNGHLKLGYAGETARPSPIDTLVANNVFVGNWNIGGWGEGTGVNQFRDGGTLTSKNNVFINMGFGYNVGGTDFDLVPDYNDYYQVYYIFLWTAAGGYGRPFVTAQGMLNTLHSETCPTGVSSECNSITTNPDLNADYTPKVTSPVKWTGTATGQASAADRAGNAWHSPPSMGAYEYGSEGPPAGDTTAPSTTITTSNSTITTNALTVTGTASDAVGVSSCKYRIGSAPDGSNGTACTGTTSWSCATTGYVGGANTLYVGCTDAAGNWGSASITVTYTPPAAPTRSGAVGSWKMNTQ